ncbi:hypothetical protein TRIP_C20086 [Candidatus Zixiibacteriota bacterium]|nr:hypothetical protein TRIP_C20086 [candidate division Zixibacteria bacterium]
MGKFTKLLGQIGAIPEEVHFRVGDKVLILGENITGVIMSFKLKEKPEKATVKIDLSGVDREFNVSNLRPYNVRE